MNYNEKLRFLRERIGYTQTHVADAIKLNRVQYNQYENDYFTIPTKHLCSLCDFFNVSIDYMLDFQKEKKSYPNYSSINNIKAGARLKEFRKENKLTQKQLATILKTSTSCVAWYENGRNLIPIPYLYIICKTYNISADYLLGKIDKKPF